MSKQMQRNESIKKMLIYQIIRWYIYKNKALCCYISIQDDIFLSINWVTIQQNKIPIRFRINSIIILNGVYILLMSVLYIKESG